jgi:hypothetical protein
VSVVRGRSADPILEAALLVKGELWDVTRAHLFEGEAVSILMSSRRNSSETSDVWVTVLARTSAFDGPGPVTITLSSGEWSCAGRLDARGCCTIRGVPNGQYRIDVCRAPARLAEILPLSPD